MFMYVLFCLEQLSHFPSCFGAGVTNLNKPPFSFLLPPHYCGLGASSVPFKGHCEQKAIQNKWVVYVAGHALPNRVTRLPWCFSFPKRKLHLFKGMI